MSTVESAQRLRCVFESRALQILEEPLFTRSQTGTEVMIRIRLGETQAMLPLAMIQREAGISNDSPDGRMIELIGQSLAFVQFIQIGDELPLEVLTGDASWAVGEEFAELALAKLEYGLVCDLASSGEEAAGFDRQTLVACVNDPAFKPRVTLAFAKVAELLGLLDGNTVTALLGKLAYELSFVEALRLWLLEGLEGLAGRFKRLRFRGLGDRQRRDVATQAQRMIHRALTEIRDRFSDIDAQTGEVIAVLRQVEAQTGYIRNRRDELYVLYRGWGELLVKWNCCTARTLDECWGLVEETYRFLAPRFMPYQEWKKAVERQTPIRPRETVW